MNIRKKFIGVSVMLSLLLTASPAFAHVVVRPEQAGVAAFQTFTVGVPNEKEIPTVTIRLVIPEGLNHVSPNVKPGWKIAVKKTGEEEDAKVTEITWTGGSIPQGQRDEFLFSAQVPAKETTLQWKAYQTYEGGETVAWDQRPSDGHGEGNNPYSETEIINDLKNSAAISDGHQTDTDAGGDKTKENLSIFLSVAALVIAVAAYMQSRRRK